MKYETAGDPMSGLKWTRKTTEKIADELESIGIRVSPNTVGKLLKKMGFSLRVNRKKIALGSKKKSQDQENRNRQFMYISELRESFAQKGYPSISVDTKKKELIGNFKNDGRVWCQEPEYVNVYDFRQDAIGRAVPYGIYNMNHNRGQVYVGTSADTPQFAVDSIATWWQNEGSAAFPAYSPMLILSDAGGSNSCRSRVWKHQLQQQLSDQFGLTITVCHYPTGCSKWNPVEHRLFSYISINWAGKPLRSFDTMLACIRGTTTTTGLTVKAAMLEGIYETGQSVPDSEMDELNLERHTDCPHWNYTIRPRLIPVPPILAQLPNREVVS